MWRWVRSRILVLLLLSLVACQPTWSVKVVGPQRQMTFDRSTFDTLPDFVREVEGQRALPLEQLLHEAGAELIAEVIVTPEEDTSQRFVWPEIAPQAWVLEDGCLQVNDVGFNPSRVEVVSAPGAEKVEASILDVAPTAAAALGLPAPAEATGRVLPTPSADHVLILLLDAFGYLRYQEAREQGDAPFISSLPAPRLGMTVYPPVTVVATGSLLTGAPPEVHGVTRRGLGRGTEVETLLDVAAEAGLRVVGVEGYAVSFNLRNAEIHLSGDRDGDGYTGDNVLTNAMAALEEGMPDLLFVHFHDIDDAGHAVGPGADDERAALARVDAAVQALVEALPPRTLVLMLADHGMHTTADGGDHGHLIERDMLVPVFSWVTDEG